MQILLIKNALILDPATKTQKKSDILIENGRIKRCSPHIKITGIKPEFVYDATGLWLMPGIIDIHVHTRQPGMEHAENLQSVSMAALAGGVTTILAMPNTIPATDSPLRLKDLRASSAALPVNIRFSAAVTKGRAGKILTDFKALKKAGAMAFTDDGACVADTDLLKQALKQAGKLKIPLLDHAEDFSLTGNGVMHESAASRRQKLPGITRESETFMVLRDLLSAAAIDKPIHLQHLSCEESVIFVRDAKRAGVKVTAETCPHYFALTCEQVKNANFKMKPPVREASDKFALIKALADGTIDIIASDHAPHTKAAKAAGLASAPFGVIGLETLLGISMTELVHTKAISKLRLAELLSLNPAKLLGLGRKGRIAVGMDADLTLIDPNLEYNVSAKFYSKSANSPFIGRRLKGKVVVTIVGGETKYRYKR